jgi:hypothetical protein
MFLYSSRAARLLRTAAFSSVVLTAALFYQAHADREIPLQDLPANVTAVIKQKYPSARVIKVETDLKRGSKYYEVKIQDGDVQREVHVRPNGTIIKTETDLDD